MMGTAPFNVFIIVHCSLPFVPVEFQCIMQRHDGWLSVKILVH